MHVSGDKQRRQTGDTGDRAMSKARLDADTRVPDRERPVTCVVCGGLFWTLEKPPHVCDACFEAFCDEFYDDAMAKLEVDARAAGFPTGEAYLEALVAEARTAKITCRT
jgi:hypothetical protein